MPASDSKPAQPANPTTYKLNYERSTKGTHVYVAPDDPSGNRPVISQLYLTKAGLPADPPAQLNIAVSW